MRDGGQTTSRKKGQIMNNTTIFYKVIEKGIERDNCDGWRFKLVFEVRELNGRHYSAELIPHGNTAPLDTKPDDILLGQWSDTGWNGSPECYYAGGGMYADPDDQYYREDGRDSVRDRRLMTPEQFREESAKLAAREIVESWYWPDEVSDDAKEDVFKLLREYLIERQGEEPELYAEEQAEKDAERAEELIKELETECGEWWRINPDDENAATWWWDNGGRDVWKKLSGKQYAEYVIVPANKGAEFIREAVNVPGFYPTEISAPNLPICDTPFIFSPANGDEE